MAIGLLSSSGFDEKALFERQFYNYFVFRFAICRISRKFAAIISSSLPNLALKRIINKKSNYGKDKRSY